MRQLDYKKGHFSPILLDDGSKIFIETLPEMVRAKKMFWFIPTKTIWQYKFPFYIRTVGEAWETSVEVLDIVLDSIKNCNSLDKLKDSLENQTKKLLDDYVYKNKNKAESKSFEKLGDFAIKKKINDLSKRDASKVPKEIWDILGEYGKVLEGLENRPVWQIHLPLSELPYPREKIDAAINEALSIVKDDKKLINSLEVSQFELWNMFLPDDDAKKENEDTRRLLNPEG